MKRVAWALLLAALLQAPAAANDADDRAACEVVKKKIRVLEAKMRHGYTAAQGIRYDARLRDLKEKRYRLCRK